MKRRDWNSLVDQLVEGGVLHSSRVINAMRRVPRSSFLPENVKSYSAVDSPLPIGWGQTISAPLD